MDALLMQPRSKLRIVTGHFHSFATNAVHEEAQNTLRANPDLWMHQECKRLAYVFHPSQEGQRPFH